MGKEPAFLFYSQDFYGGTRTMLPEERACYLDLLIYQHQNGYIPDDLKRISMFCTGVAKATLQATLQAKFKRCDKGWYNERLKQVAEERRGYCEKQSENGIVGQFYKKAKKSLKANVYKDLRNYIYNELGKENLIEMLKKDEATHEATLQALLKASLKASLKHLEDENENENEIESEVVIESKDEKEKEKNSLSLSLLKNKDKEKEKEVDKEKKEIKVKAIPKKKYGEYKHVLLTEEEYERFVKDHGLIDAQEAIKLLDEYIELKGAKYKNHNLALRKWPIHQVKENRGETFEEEVNRVKRQLGVIP